MAQVAERVQVSQRRPQPVAKRSQNLEVVSRPKTSPVANGPRANRVSTPVSEVVGGLPARLRAGVEGLSGIAMDDVRVHRNSSEPAKLGALAFTRGSEIHLGPSQEQHLPHEAWHVVQQKQGRVRAATQMKGVPLNADARLEAEADTMSQRAILLPMSARRATSTSIQPATSAVVQRRRRSRDLSETISVRWSEDRDVFYSRVLVALSRTPSFSGIDEGAYVLSSATERPFRDHVRAFQDQYHEAFGREPKQGEKVKLGVRAYYSARDDQLIGKKVSFVQDAASRAKSAVHEASAPEKCFTSPKPNETDVERVTREMDEVTCFIARQLQVADKHNRAMVFVTLKSGNSFPVSGAVVGERYFDSGRKELTYATAYDAARPSVESFYQTTEHTPSVMAIEFSLESGVAMVRNFIKPLPPPSAAAPVQNFEEGEAEECSEDDVDYGECLKLLRTEAYREGIAAAKDEFIEWYDPYNISGQGTGGGSFKPPLPGPLGKVKFPKGVKRLSRLEKRLERLQKIERSAGGAMKEFSGAIHGIRGRLKGQAVAVVEVEVAGSIRYAVATNSSQIWTKRQNALIDGLKLERIPSNLSEVVHAEGNVRAWIDKLRKTNGHDKVRVKRWGISAGINGKYICTACREIARQLGGVIEEF